MRNINLKVLIVLLNLSFVLISNCFGQTFDDYVREGRAFLAAQNPSNAMVRFNKAATIQPSNETVQVLLGASRLLVLVNDVDFQQLLNRSQFDKAGRNIYKWQSKPSLETNGLPIVDRTLTASNVFWVLAKKVCDVISLSATNFSNVRSTNFFITLTKLETSSVAVNVDYGDVQFIKSILFAIKANLLLFNTFNLPFNWEQINNLYESERLSIEKYLSVYPDALRTVNGETRSEALVSLIQACYSYFAASEFIRLRPLKSERLFSFDADLLKAEEDFYSDMARLRSSLESPTLFSSTSTESVYLGPIFESSFSIRHLAPEFRDDNIVLGSWPDRSFGGIIEERSESEFFEILSQILPSESKTTRVGVSHKIEPIVMLGNSLKIGIPASPGFVFSVEKTENLKDWVIVTNIISGSSEIVFTEVAPSTAKTIFYRFKNLNDSGICHGVVSMAKTGKPVQNASVCVSGAGFTKCVNTDDSGRFVLVSNESYKYHSWWNIEVSINGVVRGWKGFERGVGKMAFVNIDINN
jgi:hypothetical protein